MNQVKIMTSATIRAHVRARVFQLAVNWWWLNGEGGGGGGGGGLTVLMIIQMGFATTSTS